MQQFSRQTNRFLPSAKVSHTLASNRALGYIAFNEFPLLYSKNIPNLPTKSDLANPKSSRQTQNLIPENKINSNLNSTEHNNNPERSLKYLLQSEKQEAKNILGQLLKGLNYLQLEHQQRRIEQEQLLRASYNTFDEMTTVINNTTSNADHLDTRIASDLSILDNAKINFDADPRARQKLKFEMQKLLKSYAAERHNLTEASMISGKFEIILKEVYRNFVKDIADIQQNGRYKTTTPYMNLLAPETIANIVISKILYLLKANPDGIMNVQVFREVGAAIKEAVDNIKAVSLTELDELDIIHRKMGIHSKTVFGHFHGGMKQYEMEKQARKNKDCLAALEEDYWSEEIKGKLGGELLDILLESANLPVQILKMNLNNCDINSKDSETEFTRDIQKWFSFTLRKSAAKQVGYLVGNQALVNYLLKTDPFCVDIFDPVLNAMVCPPRKWTDTMSGGFLLQKHSIFKSLRPKSQQMIAAKRTKNEHSLLYDALTIMGEIPWVVNRRIFETAKRVNDENLELGGLVGAPAKESNKLMKPVAPKYDPNWTAAEKKDYSDYKMAKTEYDAIEHRISTDFQSQISKKMDTALKLKRAEEIMSYDQIWFPYNYDFRGRVYPIPAHLNHIQNDLSRALLTFKEKKPLGKSGLRWLKIHLSNLMGYDKASLVDREKFTDDKIAKGLVKDCAENPIDSVNPKLKKWWCQADDPWQALSVIFELNEALKLPNPELYETNITVHQDGSCNGLQHYAAMGRDAHEAKQVNLLPAEKPQDVYSEVCKRVQVEVGNLASKYKALICNEAPFTVDVSKEQKIPAEAFRKLVEETSDDTQDSEADVKSIKALFSGFLLLNKINRKVVKQSVMTSVYGVTFIGAKEQISARLHEMNAKIIAKHGKSGPSIETVLNSDQPEDSFLLSEREISNCALLLAKLTIDSIGESFSSATAIMKWLADVAKLCGQLGEPVSWMSPIGLPVVQAYSKPETKIVRINQRLVSFNVTQEREDDGSNENNIRKQRTAFPPNFVHSLDASHMVFTAKRCKDAGITFTAVHDSYWTHPGDVDKMNIILREEFVKLHEGNMLNMLRDQVLSRFPQIDENSLAPAPMKNDLDLKEVLKSQYFFN